MILFWPALLPSQDSKAAKMIPEFRTLAFSADGKLLAAGSGEPEEPGVLAVWNVATRRPLFTHHEKRGIPSVAFSPDGKLLAVGVFEDQCRVIDVTTGKVHNLLPGHGKAARVVAFSPDGKTLAIGSYDHTIRLWDLATLKVRKTLEGHTNWCWALAYSADGALLASGSPDQTVKLWDPAGGKLLKTLSSGFAVRHVAFVPRSRMVATIGYEGAVRMYDSNSGKLLAKLGSAGSEDLSFAPDGKNVAACGHGPEVKLYAVHIRQASTAEKKRILELITRLDDDDYDVRERASQELQDLGDLAEPFLFQAMKQTKSAEVRIRARRIRKNLRIPQPEAVLEAQDQVLCLTFSPGGETLATSGKEGLIYLWHVASRKKIATLAPR
jgi:WD40 repeat protein